LHAPKNGLFYALDRASGKLVSAAKFAEANWTTGVDAAGRPIIDHESADYRDRPKLVFPSVVGAHSWNPMAFSPKTGLVYVPTAQLGNILYDVSKELGYRPKLFDANVGLVLSGFIEFLKDSMPAAIRGELTSGHILPADPDRLKMFSYLQAWDPIAQRQVWRTAEGDWWDHAGVLATGGGLVFQGSDRGVLKVFDSATGELLRSMETGSSIMAAPAMYRVDATTYVAVLAAWGGGGWAVPHPGSAAFERGNAGRILAFKLGGGPVPLPPLLPAEPPLPRPPAQHVGGETIARGARLFGSNCAICHPNQTRSGSADLRRMSVGIHALFDDIVLKGLKRDAGMPGWGDVLSADDAHAIHAFLIDVSQQAYAAQNKGDAANGKADTGVIRGH
jgi:quinohemoprotein ethanol dehydrogenase